MPAPEGSRTACRIVYVSPLKALAVDVERNLRSPLAGIANMARRMGVPFHEPGISVRTGDTPQKERARFRATSGRDSDHDAGVAVSAADLACGRGSAHASIQSSSTRSMRWCRPSAARIWRCRSNGLRR